MAEKESEESSIDYGFISKYLRDDSDKSKNEEDSFLRAKFETKQSSGPTEVFGSVGEGESYSERPNFNRRYNNENNNNYSDNDEGLEVDIPEEDSESSDEKSEKSKSNSVTEAKKEFLKEIENDSLSLDTCGSVNYDWGNN